MNLQDAQIAGIALQHRAGYGPTRIARDNALYLVRKLHGDPNRGYGDDILAAISTALSVFIEESMSATPDEIRRAKALQIQIAKHFLEQEKAQSLSDACDYWRAGALYLSRNGYRWTRDPQKRPTGARSGSIAVPYSRVIKANFPDCSAFHRYAYHGEVA